MNSGMWIVDCGLWTVDCGKEMADKRLAGQKRVGNSIWIGLSIINQIPVQGLVRASYMGISNAQKAHTHLRTYAHTNPQFSLLPFSFSVLVISLASGTEHLHSRFLPTRFDREAGIMKRMDREETDGNWGE